MEAFGEIPLQNLSAHEQDAETSDFKFFCFEWLKATASLIFNSYLNNLIQLLDELDMAYEDACKRGAQ